MRFFTGIWKSLKWVVKLVLPLGKHAGSAARSPGAGWVLHLLAVAAILVLLYWLNEALGIRQMVESSFPTVRYVWLPVLFLLVYLVGWLGWWLWKLLNAEE